MSEYQQPTNILMALSDRDDGQLTQYIRRSLRAAGMAGKGRNYSRVHKLIKDHNLPIELKPGRPKKMGRKH